MDSTANDDRRLQQLVMEELDFEPAIDAANIGVAVDQGVVTLSGHVGSYAEKLDAERAAWRVKGVRAVVQKIDVHVPGDAPTDEEIAQHAAARLAWDVTVPDGLRMRVADGWITLEGEVERQVQRNSAAHSLQFLRGVRGIDNLIRVRPAVQPDAVRARIVDALRRNAEVEAGQIRVDVRDGHTVTLEGRVDNWAERSAAERAAWSAPGVVAVVGRLAIA